MVEGNHPLCTSQKSTNTMVDIGQLDGEGEVGSYLYKS